MCFIFFSDLGSVNRLKLKPCGGNAFVFVCFLYTIVRCTAAFAIPCLLAVLI